LRQGGSHEAGRSISGLSVERPGWSLNSRLSKSRVTADRVDSSGPTVRCTTERTARSATVSESSR